MPLPSDINFDTLRPEEFERYLPEHLFANGNGKVSEDPRLAKFLGEHPDCAALVNDLGPFRARPQSVSGCRGPKRQGVAEHPEQAPTRRIRRRRAGACLTDLYLESLSEPSKGTCNPRLPSVRCLAGSFCAHASSTTLPIPAFGGGERVSRTCQLSGAIKPDPLQSIRKFH